MKLAPIFDPAVRKPAPKPIQVDLQKAFLAVTAVWVVALVVATILLAMEVIGMQPLIVCVAGTVIGILMLIWEHFHRWDYRRLGK
ncbi:DUF2530 domain-containing protein [Bifidobacterium avesanii]|uniref:DUF2530 domain-containing protein n=1 Tax=Bifidobacterium avesanii TaxID=1798157 RepID=A0A7K3TG36_9BIFI|nr:DUF2530 domain-containing protein [Bifidobacterium avesanii]KAB8294549.1 hypothetical protein DSM100685_0342 [Bifidobacterium avesanii]NEG78061.1 DUF2530 domain-containing protein [Bifidobacterium avesanii]